MASEWDQELKRLQTATNRNLPANAEIDADTAELHGGWTTLVRLLEEADRDASLPDLVVAPQSQRSRAPQRWILAVAALAASTLVLATAGRHFMGRTEKPITEAPTGDFETVDRETVIADREVSPELLESTATYGWDDDLEDSFEQLAQQIAGFRGSGYVSGSPYSVLEQRIEDLQEEMNEL